MNTREVGLKTHLARHRGFRIGAEEESEESTIANSQRAAIEQSSNNKNHGLSLIVASTKRIDFEKTQLCKVYCLALWQDDFFREAAERGGTCFSSN